MPYEGFNMKNKIVKFGIIATILPHIFCCVLPVVMGIVGLFAPEVAHTEYIPEWIEPWIFVLSSIMLGMSWIFVLRDCPCCNDDHCDDDHHVPQKILLGIITVLFIISVILHIAAHH